jgi:hypothetical protein
MNNTIFYSWQSDINSDINKIFIENAIKDAIKIIGQDLEIEEAVRNQLDLDKDTQGEPGIPPVVDIIFKKISDCTVFIPDLTFVGNTFSSESEKQRLIPNPNVLIEYGWALKSIGHQRIVPVMNTAFGEPDDSNMPFDMRHLRWPKCCYYLKKDSSEQERDTMKKQLTTNLVEEIKLILQKGYPGENRFTAANIKDKKIFLKHPNIIYKKSVSLAKQKDITEWRKITKIIKDTILPELIPWRKKYNRNPPKNPEEAATMVLEGLNPYCNAFAVALAGIESETEPFNRQSILLDDILSPKEWNYAGRRDVATLPIAIGYIYHMLHGAQCIKTNQISLAISFAKRKVWAREQNKSLPILQCIELTGWAHSLGGSSVYSWDFINTLLTKLAWLTEVFDDIDSYRENLCGYYLLLNIIEFIDVIRQNKEAFFYNNPTTNPLQLEVPIDFFVTGNDILRKSYQMLLENSTQLKKIWGSIEIPKLKKFWPKWIDHIKGNIDRTHMHYSIFNTIPHKDLFDDIYS